METVHAVYEGKTFRLKHHLDLKPGQEVELIVKELVSVETDPSFDIASLAVETEITDLAVEHDHYLYSTPKHGKKDAR
ncbi:MAG: antitoxin family protein [Candidatus Methanoperedens sp.]|nr:antitoxin family protein [Candidatus Methanoperedens sp.]